MGNLTRTNNSRSLILSQPALGTFSKLFGRKLIRDFAASLTERRIYESKAIFLCAVTQTRSLWLLLLICFVAVVEVASARTNNSAPPVETIVAHMAQARAENQASFRAYTVTRDYSLFGRRDPSAKSRVIAEMKFTPPGTKDFVIRQTAGTGMGEKIVRGILAGEAELSNSERSEISPANYNFRLLGEEEVNGRRCYVLELSPKRREKNLISGKAWVDSETYLLHRAEGAPAQKPSFWVRDIHIVLSYGNVEGMWLQTGMEATASVRLVGDCKMVAHDVKYDISGFALARAENPPDASAQKAAGKARASKNRGSRVRQARKNAIRNVLSPAIAVQDPGY